MNFIIFINKDEEKIQLKNILSHDSTSYYSTSFRQTDFEKITSIVYESDRYSNNTEFCKIENEQFFLNTGILLAKNRPTNYTEILSQNSVDKSQLIGDYLSIYLDKNGNGRILRPTGASFNQLFLYQDGDLQIISSDIALIVKSVRFYLNNPLIKDMNPNFIYDAIHNEWKRKYFPKETFLKRIKRIDPIFTDLTFNNFKLVVKKKELNEEIDKSLESLFLSDRNKFYDKILDEIALSNKLIFSNLDPKKVTLSLTGGLDSRCTLAILVWLQKILDFEIKTETLGVNNHPDVEIAKRISSELGITHLHLKVDTSKKPFIPETIVDYQDCFFTSWGNWNSNNYRIEREPVKELKLTGLDIYKYYPDLHNWNKWSASLRHNMTVIPILSEYESSQYSLICHKYKLKKEYLSFVYHLLNRFCPELLEIPFVGIELPLKKVPPYKTVADSKIMHFHVFPAYFDSGKVSQLFNGLNHSGIKTRLNLASIRTEREKRIAMDFASVFDLKGSDITKEHRELRIKDHPRPNFEPNWETELALRLKVKKLELQIESDKWLRFSTYSNKAKLWFILRTSFMIVRNKLFTLIR